MSTQPLLERRLQVREETRRTILAAAEEILVERGVDGFSVRALAARCGCTAATLYHYFADKEQLVDELLASRLEGLNRELASVERSGFLNGLWRPLLGQLRRPSR